MKKLFAAFVGALALLVLIPGAAATADNDTASVRVVHGIPGQDLGLDPALPVDVLVNDELCALQGFTFGEIAGPLALPAGSYNVKISLADAGNPCGNAAVIEADVSFAGNEDASVVAHLTEDGMPTASKFTNDTSRTAPGKARLIAHHTAAAPTVDVWVARGMRGPALTVQDFSNGDQAAAQVRPGAWNVAIAPAGFSQPVFGPVSVELQPFTTYLVYAVGSVDTGSFTLLVDAVR